MSTKRAAIVITRGSRPSPSVPFSSLSTARRLASRWAPVSRNLSAANPRYILSRTPLCLLTTCSRHLSTSFALHKEAPPNPSGIPQPKVYDFSSITSLSSTPDPKRILIDVREPSELLATGTIPSSINIPISSAPDAFFLPESEFEDRYGFAKPGKDTEVVFFCKAGVRSRQAARLAGQAGFGGKVGEYPGSWLDWAENGGKVEKV
jgi:rhodanese-related sulfurtransferase